MQKGRSHHLLKKALLKKKHDALMETEATNKKHLETIPALCEQIEDLKEALYRKEEEMKRFEDDAAILKDLYEKGIIDSNGDPIIHE